jgi:hypothetical protein
MRLSKDDILKTEDNAPEEVEVPEWGGSVLVRGMSGRERDAFEVSMRDHRSGQRLPGALTNDRAKNVARCIVDDGGERLFTDSDIAALGEKSAAAIDRIYEVAARKSGMSEADEKEMAANFGQASGDDSSSTSPNASARRQMSS